MERGVPESSIEDSFWSWVSGADCRRLVAKHALFAHCGKQTDKQNPKVGLAILEARDGSVETNQTWEESRTSGDTAFKIPPS